MTNEKYAEKLRSELLSTVKELFENGYCSDEIEMEHLDDIHWTDYARSIPELSPMSLDTMRKLITIIDEKRLSINDKNVFNEFIHSENIDLYRLTEFSTSDALRDIMSKIAFDLEEKSTASP